MSEQCLRYHISRLIQQGYVKRSLRTSYAENELTPKGRRYLSELKQSSLPVRTPLKGSVRVHNLTLKFPILQDNPSARFDRSVELTHWVKDYTSVTFPISVMLERTTKSIIVDFRQFQTSKPLFEVEFLQWVTKGIFWVYAFLWKEYEIKVDVFDYEVLRQHLATEAPEFEGAIPPRVQAEVEFPRKATSLQKNLKQRSKAWIDRSLGKLEIETNCDTYEVNVVKMPERIAHIDAALAPTIDRLSNELRLHLEVLSEIAKNIRRDPKEELKGTRISLA